MESEKVKEIKKCLECCKQNEIEDTCKYCLDCPTSDWDYEKECKIDLVQKTITLINELESENERLNKSDTSKEESSIEYYNLYKDFKRENQTLKERIAELEKENGELVSKFIDSYNDSLKEFAEKLKKRTILYSGINVKYEAITADIIDETLKEYEK